MLASVLDLAHKNYLTLVIPPPDPSGLDSGQLKASYAICVPVRSLFSDAWPRAMPTRPTSSPPPTSAMPLESAHLPASLTGQLELRGIDKHPQGAPARVPACLALPYLRYLVVGRDDGELVGRKTKTLTIIGHRTHAHQTS